MTGTAIHNCWKGILTRCYNKNFKQYKDYGGRGIAVCEEWHTFENFYDDMHMSWSKGLTIDRIDNDGDYSHGNCRWIPLEEQSKNRRDSALWSFTDKPHACNTSGLKGACWDKSRNKWIAIIGINRKYKNLGRFDTKEEAHEAYLKAAAELRG